MTEKLHISRVRISNVLGITELELEPGRFTELSGANGSGKTSVLEAIKAALRGGHDATLLRKGAERGEVVLVLDDGTEITKRVTGTGSDTKVRKDGAAQPRAAETIRKLTDLLSVNPVDFLKAPAKDRVQALLEAMPITVDMERIAKISGLQAGTGIAGGGLSVIDAVRRMVYDERTGVNRAAKEKAATVSQLEAAMPAAPGGVDGDEDSLRQQLDDAKAAFQAEAKGIDDKLAGLRTATQQTIDTLKADAQAKIDAIKAQLDADVAAQRDHLSDSEAKAARVKQKAVDGFNATATPLQTAISTIAANRDAAAKRKATQETVAKMRGEVLALEEESAAQTAALDGLDAYKLELLASLPIPGLEIRDGEVFRDGVAFDRLNTGQQVAIAVEVAKLRAGALGVICVDGLELLDAGHYAAFRQAAVDSGLQLFVTRVGDGPFQISTEVK